MSDTSATPVILGDSEEEGDTTITVAPVIIVTPPAEEPAPVEEPPAEVEAPEIQDGLFDIDAAIGELTIRVGALEEIVYAEPAGIEEIEEIEEVEEGDAEGEEEGEPGEGGDPERVEPTSKKVHWLFRKFSDWRA